MKSSENHKIKINFETEKVDWDKFVETSPQGNIFVTSTFLDSLQDQYKIVTCKQNEVIVAGAVVFEKSGIPLGHLQAFTQYIGFLLSPPEYLKGQSKLTWEFKITGALLEALCKKYETLAFSHSYNFQDLRPFLWFNYGLENCKKFSSSLRYTSVLTNLFYEDHEKYLMKIRTTRRQEYRKAVKNLKLEKSDCFSGMIEMYKKTIERSTKKTDIFAEETVRLEKIVSLGLEKNIGELFYAIYNHKKIGAIFILKFQNHLYYLVGASSEEGRKMFSNTFLLIEVIKKFFSEGYQSFDFLGVNSPNRGDFKVSFSGTLKIFFETKLK